MKFSRNFIYSLMVLLETQSLFGTNLSHIITVDQKITRPLQDSEKNSFPSEDEDSQEDDKVGIFPYRAKRDDEALKYILEITKKWTSNEKNTSMFPGFKRGELSKDTLVTRKDGKTVGFVNYDDEKIMLVAVDPDYQKNGYGTSLLEAVFEELAAKGKWHVGILANVKNFSARRLYERLGFKLIGCDCGNLGKRHAQQCEQVHYAKTLIKRSEPDPYR